MPTRAYAFSNNPIRPLMDWPRHGSQYPANVSNTIVQAVFVLRRKRLYRQLLIDRQKSEPRRVCRRARNVLTLTYRRTGLWVDLLLDLGLNCRYVAVGNGIGTSRIALETNSHRDSRTPPLRARSQPRRPQIVSSVQKDGIDEEEVRTHTPPAPALMGLEDWACGAGRSTASKKAANMVGENRPLRIDKQFSSPATIQR